MQHPAFKGKSFGESWEPPSGNKQINSPSFNLFQTFSKTYDYSNFGYL